MFSLDMDKRQFTKALKNFEDMGKETKKLTKNKATKIFRTEVKRVKGITPVGETGNLKKAVGLKTTFKRDVLTWRVIFRSKKAPYANAVNFAKWHPQEKFFTNHFHKTQAQLEKLAQKAIIEAVLGSTK